MTVLVIGGAASGKSAYAENLLCRLAGDAPKVYIATMEPYGAEAAARIAKHRQARAHKGFCTVERLTDLCGLRLPYGSAALLEDLGNLCANERYSPAGSGPDAEASILRGVARLRTQCPYLVIVSNEIFRGGTAYDAETLRYLRTLARLHRTLARLCDGVCEVVCGVPAYCKGGDVFATL